MFPGFWVGGFGFDFHVAFVFCVVDVLHFSEAVYASASFFVHPVEVG